MRWVRASHRPHDDPLPPEPDLPSSTSRPRRSIAIPVRCAVAVGLLVVVWGDAGAWVEPPDGEDGRGGPAAILNIRPPFDFAHDVGLLRLQITNIGMIGNRWLPNTNSAEWRQREYLFAAGLWVGARRSDGTAWVTTAEFEEEFRPELGTDWRIREAFEGMARGNRVGFSTAPTEEAGPGVGDIRTSGANDDWDGGRDLLVDEDFLNGLDDDLDGLVDEDFAAIGQQMFACQYWDIPPGIRDIYPDHRPLDILVQQESFAWAVTGANEFVGFDFTVWNVGQETLRDVYLAFFVDGDVGPKSNPSHYLDDKGGFVAIDTTVARDGDVCPSRRVSMDLTHMFDVPDVEIAEEAGGVRGGDASGYFGAMFLGHSTDPLGVTAPSQVGIRRARFFSSSEPYPDGDPGNDLERYDLISGTGVPTRETIDPADYRYCISAGPFESLPPDTFLTFQTAFVVGEGREGMIRNAVGAQLIFDGAWRNADGSPETGIDGKETCLRPGRDDAGLIQWDNPCDTAAVVLSFDWPGYCAPDLYVDNDCDDCTPTVRGAETLVNWVGTVAPASPGTNADAPGSLAIDAPGGNREVILRWDNLSELKADPVQQRILFEGYRVWRVEGWRRPVGSTGPGPGDWQLIAEYRLHPTDPPDSCFLAHPEVGGAEIALLFDTDATLGNWDPTRGAVADLDGDGRPDWDPDRVLDILPDDPCLACPSFCWPTRPFRIDESLAPIQTGIATGDTTPGAGTRDLYPVGRYAHVDREGIKNGMIYFYDVTAFSQWCDPCEGDDVRYFELAAGPVAREEQRVVPTWPARDSKDEIYVVPNPYVQGDRNVLPWGWDLIPSDADPTGTRLAFANLPRGRNEIKIYTLAGDLVDTLEHDARGDDGTAFWDLVSRNGQDIVAGVYLYAVKTEGRGTQVGRFTVIR